MSVIKYHSGLKFFYRQIGLVFAKIFYNLFGTFNPNLLTNLSTFIHIIYMGLFLYFKNPLIFIFGLQLALMFDYADGSYARLTNQITKFGKKLDGLSDIVKLFLTFAALFYFTINEPKNFISLIILLLTYTFNTNLSVLELQSKKRFVEEEDKKYKKEGVFKNLLKSPFGFTITHFYLYFSLWLFFNNTYILVVLIIMGLLSSFKTILNFFNE